MDYDVIVIGGGPAGMMAAGTAALFGSRVLLLEQNEKTGKKLFITGKGRCNVTNGAPISEFMEHIPGNGRFLYSAFSAFNNEDLRELLRREGVETKVERGGRVFPVSDKSSDVIKALNRYIGEATVKLCTPVAKVLFEGGRAVGVVLKDGTRFSSSAVILATGGVSYPQTGSGGDGYGFAEEAGHTIVKPRGSLVPLETVETWPRDVMGLSLKNVELKAVNEKGQTLFCETGEMLFTHFGISGPLVLSASAHMRQFSQQRYTVYIDAKPGLTEEQLDARILRDFSAESNKDFINSLDKLLPKKLIVPFVALTGVAPRQKVNSITKEQRQKICHTFKHIPLTIKKPRPVAEAIITAGGVHTKEVSPKTMESKLMGGLYFAGEILDVDAYTGGFNLQIAFSTGYLAGMSAARQMFDEA